MKKNKIFKKGYLKAYSMTEVIIVLIIIGVLYYMVVPNQSSVVSKAKAIEAQSMLNQVYALQKSNFYQNSKYSSNLIDIGFEAAQTIDDGGQAVYRIEVVEAGTNTFLARATALSDFDGDGIYNVWEIDEKKILKEVTKD